MKTHRILFATPICALLAACGSNSVQVMSDISGSYDSQNFASYHKDRDTRVVILGDTFGMNGDDFARKVTAAMEGQNFGGRTHFTATPGPDADKSFRVVVAFNTTASARDLCSAKAVTPSRESGATTVEAAWCWANSAQSVVSARALASGPSDPRFAALVAEATRSLFPSGGRERKLRESTVEDD